MNIKKLSLAGVFASTGILGAETASASCVVNGLVTQVATTGTSTNVYIRPINSSAAVPNFVYYFTTTNLMMATTLTSSLHKTVQITGNANACPTSGIYRPGGVATLVYVN